MKLEPTSLSGAFVLELEPHEDERGFFARTFSVDELAARGLDTRVAQCSLSRNYRAGTLRGMHYQAAPHAEVKVVRCVRGEIFDAIVDLRAGSPTQHRWFGVVLSADRGNALYIPEGFAHGFVTLTDGADVLYQISVPYVPDGSRGIRWNDPTVGIEWPLRPLVISDRDARLPLVES